MHRGFLYSLALVAGLVVAACNSAAPPVAVAPSENRAQQQRGSSAADEHSEEDIAPRITLAEAKKDFDNGTAVFIDTHPKAQYDAGHIPGAINLQANQIKFEMDKVPKGKKIIAYCS